MPRIFVLEDDPHYRKILATVFFKIAPEVELTFASTLEEYAQNIATLSSFDLIIYDGSIGEKRQRHSNTAPLVRALKATGYSGVVVGLSASTGCLGELEEAGCDHVFNKGREGIGAVRKILAILNSKKDEK